MSRSKLISRLVQSKRWRFLSVVFLITLILVTLATIQAHTKIERLYTDQFSSIITDRFGKPIKIYPNQKGHYLLPATELSPEFISLLLTKEDRWFYYHPGINPVSTARALWQYFKGETIAGASTITQQLAKNLLNNETQRSLGNKLTETWYSLVLEITYSKTELLNMYANTVYLGNQIQGFETATQAYFEIDLTSTATGHQLALLATLSAPNSYHPWTEKNEDRVDKLAKHLGVAEESWVYPTLTNSASFQSPSFFELEKWLTTCPKTCPVTIDDELTRRIRQLVFNYTERENQRGARQAAVVILKPQTGEIISLVGSRDPYSSRPGDQINFTQISRPTGSALKPLIFLAGFKQGLRPYTIVDDREYRYPIATGFSLYPKNYDGQYYGLVTLHHALSNSLNVPAVKVLEYIGLPQFYYWLSDSLGFVPLRDYDSYQYGIALGGLEMDLLTLTHYFSIIPGQGKLVPLVLSHNLAPGLSTPHSHIDETKLVSDPAYAQLVHAVLRDRQAGVQQFGLVNNLTVPLTDYGVKTGTSRDYHDSWIVGYTADFVVGVWVGNAENEPLDAVSGSTGAGVIWNEVMQLLANSPYNSRTSLPATQLINIENEATLEWGLPSDIFAVHQNLLTNQPLIISPHHGDTFVFNPSSRLRLRASMDVDWTINESIVGSGASFSFSPPAPGRYEITATTLDQTITERIVVNVVLKD